MSGSAKIANFEDLGDYAAGAVGVVASDQIAVIALDNLADVAISSPAAGDRLRYDGSGWVNSALLWAPLTVYDPGLATWLPLVDGDGNTIMAEV